MSRRKMKTASSPLPAKARLLLNQLATQYADATPSEWDELREHLQGQMTVLAGGSSERRELLVREFETVRATTLAGRWGRQVRRELAAGNAVMVEQRGDGLEQWQLELEGEVIRFYVPAASDAKGVREAREALLSGHCRGCQKRATVEDGYLEVEHNPRCVAKKVMDDLF